MFMLFARIFQLSGHMQVVKEILVEVVCTEIFALARKCSLQGHSDYKSIFVVKTLFVCFL